MDFQYINLQGAAMEIDAMDNTRALLAGYGYTTDQCFVYSTSFLTFEGNKVNYN